MPAGDYTTCKVCGNSIFGSIPICETCNELNKLYGNSFFNMIKAFSDSHRELTESIVYTNKKQMKHNINNDNLNNLYDEIIEGDKPKKINHNKKESLSIDDVFENFFKDSSPKKRNTFVVNLFAGPGSGKSSLAAGIFYELKSKGITCELALEFVKDLVWEERHKAINNQIYIFAKQHHRITRLLGEVDVIITDSPLLLSLVYASNETALAELARVEHNKLLTFNCFIKRNKDYNPKGRMHTFDEARKLDIRIASMLDKEHIPYGVYFGNNDGRDRIVNQILNIISSSNNQVDK